MPPIAPEPVTEVIAQGAEASDLRPSRVGAFDPLGLPVFRVLWGTWLIANVCT